MARWLKRTKVRPFHRAGQRSWGRWGEHTSSIDWCEDNYVHLPYIAETWNTLSNIPFILLGLHGALKVYSSDLPHRSRYALPHLGIAVIGMGSFIFHATLNWHAQVLLDELPMIFVSTLCLYVVLMAGGKAWWKPWMVPALLILDLTISTLYIANPNPVFHQLCYAGIQLASNLRVWNLIKRLPPNSAPRRDSASLLLTGTMIFLLGFAVWNVDNQYCNTLTWWRGMYGDIVGALTQGHAWWHLMTGVGSSRIIVGMSYLTLSIEDPNAFELGHALGFLPYVKRKAGSTKKVQ